MTHKLARIRVNVLSMSPFCMRTLDEAAQVPQSQRSCCSLASASSPPSFCLVCRAKQHAAWHAASPGGPGCRVFWYNTFFYIYAAIYQVRSDPAVKGTIPGVTHQTSVSDGRPEPACQTRSYAVPSCVYCCACEGKEIKLVAARHGMQGGRQVWISYAWLWGLRGNGGLISCTIVERLTS